MLTIDQIRGQFHEGILQYKKASEIMRLLGISSRPERENIAALLRELEVAGEIVHDNRGRFVSPEKLGLVRGIIQGSERGFAFLLRQEEGDLFIPAKSLHGALHGDDVFVNLVDGGRGDEAEVYSVIRRGVQRLTGVYERGRRGGFVYPDERRFCEVVRIVSKKVCAVSGEKVCVRIVAYPKGQAPEGVIERVLGRGGELLTEEDAIICMHDLPEEFSKKALETATRAAKRPIVAEGRRDFRECLVVTIDGEDSRDFDDAISVERKGNCYVLSVHIADVSHYVLRGDVLDKEAFCRGTSVYFPDRVLPMIPAALSEGACSLKEGEDRYTLSCVMTIDADGRICNREVVKGIIRSRNRMTYTQVADILEGKEPAYSRYMHLVEMLNEAKMLAEILMERRVRRGGLDLNMKEAQICLTDGRVCVKAYERTIAHRMVEAFMICANEAIAAFLQEHGGVCLYRVHDKPSEERADAFREFLKGLGLCSDFVSGNVRAGDYAAILHRVNGMSNASVVKNVMLRSMAKARYSPENIGHFGLASDCYCHFTSPIRRYPDLLVHRLVKLVLERVNIGRNLQNFIRIAANDCSQTERRAEETERAVDDLYKVWYMKDHLGEHWSGIISGMTSVGIFIEIENMVEGIARIEDLPKDEYVYDKARMTLRGKTHSYRLGDTVEVIVSNCDVGARRCRFILVE